MEKVLIIDPDFKTKDVVKKKLNRYIACGILQDYLSPVKLNLFLEVSVG